VAPPPFPSGYLSRRGLLAAVGGGLASVAAGALRPGTVLPALDADPRVPSGEWPTHKRDPARTGYQPEPGPRDGLVERWRRNVGPANAVAPGLVASGGRVLTVGRYATRTLAADDGSLEWTTRQEDRFAGTFPGELPYEFVQAGPYVAGDRTLVVSGSSLHALSVDGGRHDWAFPTTSSFGSVLRAGNAVFAGVSLSGGDRLVALDRDSGVPWWDRETPGVPLAFAPDEGLLLVAADSLGEAGTLVARDPADGSVVWRVDRPGYPFSPRWPPAVAGGRVYAGRGPVYALSTADGSEAWSAPLDGLDLDHGPVTDGDGVYLTGEATALALDATSGERRWTVPVGTTSLAPPAVAGDTLYVPTPTGVTALRTDDGTERFRHEPASLAGTVRGLVAADGRLYLRDDRTVRALEDDG
jgi:outer membrane protein assembly factor BamB